MYPIVQAWHIHACIILLLILIHSMPHTILVGNCGNSYNVWLLIDESHFILLHSALKQKKSQRSNISKCFPLVLRFFLPPRQDIASLAHLDDFRQVQAVWLHETRQEGLSAPSPCCEEMFSVRTLSGKHHCSRRGCFWCCMLSHFASSFQREKRSLISIETSLIHSVMIRQRSSNSNKPGITWPLRGLTNLWS